MKRAIITGGAGLIGTGLCSALAEQGYEVASFDVEQGPEGVRHIHCDVGDETSVTGAFEELGWDSLDLLVNNAGVAGPENGPISELSLTECDRAGLDFRRGGPAARRARAASGRARRAAARRGRGRALSRFRRLHDGPGADA